MVMYILVMASYPPTETNNMIETSATTRMEYPAYIKKLYDLGGNYTNYTLYKCEDAKLTDAVRFIGNRYHKIASQVPGYEFDMEILQDVVDIENLLGS